MDGSASLLVEIFADRSWQCSSNRHDNWTRCWILWRLGENNFHEINRLAHDFSDDHACVVQLQYGRRMPEGCARPQAQMQIRAM